jgi:hypothetical protein
MRLDLRASAFVCAAVSMMSVATRAAVVTVPDSIDDFEAQKNSTTNAYIASENFATGSRVGFQANFNGSGTGAPGGITSLYFFQLPALGPGESISGATFSIGRLADSSSAVTTVAPGFGADLYALGVVDAITKDAAAAQKFFYLGDTAQAALPAGGPTVGGSVSRLADNFFTSEDWIANGGAASSADSADLTSYVQNLYSNPAANGFTPGTSYLVVRLNPDTDTPPATGTQRYTTTFQGTAANGGAGAPENRPLVTLNVVPEPTTAGILLLGAVGLLRRRRA